MYRVGLTGGIGSGKSTAARLFAELGAGRIDADHMSRIVMSPGGRAWQPLIDWLGDDYIAEDGTLDRRKIRQRVFDNPAELEILESLVHPAINLEIAHQLDLLSDDHDYVVIEIPLLKASHRGQMVDRVLVVDCPETLQIERASSRDGVAEKDIRKILKQQISREERNALADDLIDNSGSLEHLREQIHTLHELYEHLATAAD